MGFVRPWHRTKRERWIALKAHAQRALGDRGFDRDEAPDDPGRSIDGGGGDGIDGGELVLKFDPNEPRDEHGRWTDGGGSDDDIAEVHHVQGAVDRPHTTFNELKGANADTFHKAVQDAKEAHESGAAVDLHSVDEYKDMRTFLTQDKKAGFALHGTNIVSVFKHPDSKEQKFAKTALKLATEQGGRRLDAFDTVLPQLYSSSGFRAVARLKFDPKFAPPGWDKKKFAEYNKGKPDVVFMVHDPEHAAPYKAGDGKRVTSYDEGVGAQQDAITEIDRSRTEAARTQNIAGASERVSTTVPSAKKQSFDPHQRQDLSPSYDTFKQAMKTEGYAESIGKLMDKYGEAFIPLPKDATSAEKAEAFVEHAKSNILALYDAQKPELRERSGTWYTGANKIAHDFGEEYGVSPRAVAGVMASLSPQRDWDQNVELAKRVLDIAVKNKDVPFTGEAAAKTKTTMLEYAARLTKEAEELEAKNTGTKADKTKIANRRGVAKSLNDLATRFEGKSFSQIPDLEDRAMLVRFYDEGTAAPGRSYPIWNPEGTQSGDIARNKGKDGEPGSPKNIGWGSFVATANALRILGNDDRANISAQLGENHKVRNFYNNIIAPDYGKDTTIDTHAVAAGTMMPLGGNDELVKEGLGMAGPGNAETGLKGVYSLYSEAYRRAADERKILPREMQSTTWEAVRGLFNPEEKRDVKLEASVNDTWKRYQEGKIDRAAAQREILDRGIKPPRWAKSYVGADPQSGR